MANSIEETQTLPNLENPHIAGNIAKDISKVKQYYRIVRIGPFEINNQQINRYFIQEARLCWKKPWFFNRKIKKRSLLKAPDAVYKWKTIFIDPDHYLMDYSDATRNYEFYVIKLQEKLLKQKCKEYHIVNTENLFKV